MAAIHTIKSAFGRIISLADTWPLPPLAQSQYWPLERQKAFQSERLVDIYTYHYDNTPAYRQLCCRHGLTRRSISGIEDLHKLPAVDRDWMRMNCSPRDSKFFRGSMMRTGGSTGEPFEYIGCRRYDTLRNGAHQRGWGYFGFQDGCEFTLITSAQGKVANGKYLSGELDNENIGKVVDALNSDGNPYVRAYASSAAIVAIYMLQHGIENKKVEVFNLISENLYDWQRDVIKTAFTHADVYEEYCCNDGGASAWECSCHSGLHEAIERAIIEPASDGEMLVTDLWNRAMPFIRYKNGDYLVERVLDKCECGRTLPRIRVRGRMNDVLVTPNGPVSPSYLLHWGSGCDAKTGQTFNSGFAQVQYIQSPGYCLMVNMVKNDLYKDSNFARLKEQVERICCGMHITYQFVDRIETTPSGKRRFIINNDPELLSKWKAGA